MKGFRWLEKAIDSRWVEKQLAMFMAISAKLVKVGFHNLGSVAL